MLNSAHGGEAVPGATISFYMDGSFGGVEGKVLLGQAITDKDGAAHYDANVTRHDHAICQRCGRLLDVSVQLPRKLVEEVRRRTGLHVQSHHVQFLGLCADCAKS